MVCVFTERRYLKWRHIHFRAGQIKKTTKWQCHVCFQFRFDTERWLHNHDCNIFNLTKHLKITLDENEDLCRIHWRWKNCLIKYRHLKNRTIVNPCYDYSSLTYIQCLVPCCFKIKNNDNATASLIRGTICFS